MNNYELSIVLPCYNESGNIPLIFEKIEKLLENQEKIEVILVNNGSLDNSKEVFNQEMERAKNENIKIVDINVNQGYGFGIMQGVYAAKGDVVAWTHADMQTDPNDVVMIYNKYHKELQEHSCYAKGRRIERSFFDTFFTWAMSKISSLLLGVYLDDVNGQPKIFNRKFVEKLDKAPDDFSLDLYLMVKAHSENLELKTLPVSFVDRVHGEAKGGGSLIGKYKLIVRTFKYIFKTREEIKKGIR